LLVPAHTNKRPISKGSEIDYSKRRTEVKVGEVFSMLEDRLVAVGSVDDFPHDKLLNHLTTNAERLFEPKKIITSSDWLKS